MATLVIRNIEDGLHARLKTLAASHGRSMEEEVRVLLRQGVAAAPLEHEQPLGQAIRAIFEPLGGLELPDVPHEPPRDPPDFSGPEWDEKA